MSNEHFIKYQIINFFLGFFLFTLVVSTEVENLKSFIRACLFMSVKSLSKTKAKLRKRKMLWRENFEFKL